MKPRMKTTALVLLLGAVTVQLIRPDTGKPPVDPARSLWNDRRVDRRVVGILRRACANCHSYETEWPWYARIAPISWWLAGHVNHGREKLNFDNWPAAASADQMEEIYDSIEKEKMPLRSYLLMHPEARLSQADRDVLIAWVALSGSSNTK